ncbi:glycoside hydrolase family 15 protein [Acidisphaera sp. S103]|uniref:glycoside hydrolase family 15 protein n=1 Tax=Acidisphaera sp. S103 TaxID=1747223 RepID=UPI00131C2603|nr:glycoside hydrolase family 15 protein [Acidisphaera sp. S103]
MPAGRARPSRSPHRTNSPDGSTPERADDAAPAHVSAIEDYALIGDCRTAALVSKDGSIDWLCWPRFDSPACFAALLGSPDNGRWRIAPVATPVKVTRRYWPGTLILETLFETASGSAALIDFMAVEKDSVVRIVEGRTGSVEMQFDLCMRFEYGSAVPWVTRLNHGSGIRAIAGPDQVVLQSDVKLHGRSMTTVASFTAEPGQRTRFVLTHAASHLPLPIPPHADQALDDTDAAWTSWTGRGAYRGTYRDAVQRSLLTLKALSYYPTGGIVAAPTTSLPERLGGSRNWDYRFCWLRDATFTLLALMHAGYREEAQAWGAWLRRGVAGSPDQLQTLYGLGGERWAQEWEVPWLSGYQGAKPVRVGNAASAQLQLDVYGELIDALYQESVLGLARPAASWPLQRSLVGHLEKIWTDPDESIWEVRGDARHFTFSKVMVWVALDRAIRGAEQFGLPAPLDRWRALRTEVHARVCREGFNAARNSFVQAFGGDTLDASLLLIPLVGFLPAADPRVIGTVAAIGSDLMVDGLVRRYHTDEADDGLTGGEGVFLACSFWYVDNLALQGHEEEARAMFERLLALANDVGLLAEEYDPVGHRQLGNFPQAFSHLALINTALNLDTHTGPAAQRSQGDDPASEY